MSELPTECPVCGCKLYYDPEDAVLYCTSQECFVYTPIELFTTLRAQLEETEAREAKYRGLLERFDSIAEDTADFLCLEGCQVCYWNHVDDGHNDTCELGKLIADIRAATGRNGE